MSSYRQAAASQYRAYRKVVGVKTCHSPMTFGDYVTTFTPFTFSTNLAKDTCEKSEVRNSCIRSIMCVCVIVDKRCIIRFGNWADDRKMSLKKLSISQSQLKTSSTVVESHCYYPVLSQLILFQPHPRRWVCVKNTMSNLSSKLFFISERFRFQTELPLLWRNSVFHWATLASLSWLFKRNARGFSLNAIVIVPRLLSHHEIIFISRKLIEFAASKFTIT